MIKPNTQQIIFTALLSIFNILGSQLAFIFKLPVYLDTTGTMVAAFLFGPFYGALCGLVSNLLSGILFDPYAFFFTPSGILVGLLAGWLYKNGFLEGKRTFLGIFILGFFPSLLSSAIAAGVFEGITSSGSSILARWLHLRGVNLVLSVFMVQILTDLLDKGLTSQLGLIIKKRLSRTFGEGGRGSGAL